ncbi:MAG: hypothetical protein LPK58_09685 [Gammaproteobacteria bacterium]|nr:hypothetical protein [Gammaproteobacteria bacterium]
MHRIKGLHLALLATLAALLLGACATTPQNGDVDGAAAGGTGDIERELKECYLIGQMYLWSLADYSRGLSLEEAQETRRRAFFNNVPELAEHQRAIAATVYAETPQGRYPDSRYLRTKYAECSKTTSDPELGQKSTMCFNLVLLSEVVHEMRDAGQSREQVAEAFSAANQNLESYAPMIDAIFASERTREDYNAGLFTRCLGAYVLEPAG